MSNFDWIFQELWPSRKRRTFSIFLVQCSFLFIFSSFRLTIIYVSYFYHLHIDIFKFQIWFRFWNLNNFDWIFHELWPSWRRGTFSIFLVQCSFLCMLSSFILRCSVNFCHLYININDIILTSDLKTDTSKTEYF